MQDVLIEAENRASFDAGYRAGELEAFNSSSKIICEDLWRELTDKAYAEFTASTGRDK